MTRILIVEDEEKISRFLQLELEHEGYSVGLALDGRRGLELAESGQYDLLVLDLMLPELSGMEVLRRLRKSSSMPVILLTARDSVMDKVAGLDSGANDYITKPFAIEELLARIRVLLRRTPTPVETGELHWGKLVLRPAAREVWFGEEEVSLSQKEFSLLMTLLENKNIVLSRDTLLNKIWGYQYIGETNVVDVYIRYLRSKIDDRYGVKMIRTVRGVGYAIRDTEG